MNAVKPVMVLMFGIAGASLASMLVAAPAEKLSDIFPCLQNHDETNPYNCSRILYKEAQYSDPYASGTYRKKYQYDCTASSIGESTGGRMSESAALADAQPHFNYGYKYACEGGLAE